MWFVSNVGGVGGEESATGNPRRGSVLEVLGAATRLGLTSFGGPIAHIGYYRAEYVQRRGWVDEATFADLVALAQFLPGAASSKLGIKTSDRNSAVANVATARADFGLISRDLRADELVKVRSIPFAATGTGLAVNPSNRVVGLTKAEVRRVFSGEVTDWVQPGGSPGEIRPFVRELGSATRASFEAYFFGGAPVYGKNVVELSNSAAMFQAVRNFSGGVGMACPRRPGT